MTIPVYDFATLPCVTFPMKNTHTKTKRYLGNKAITGKITTEINIIAETDAEMNALYEFWYTECNAGLEPFLIALPIFGKDGVTDLLSRWNGDFIANKETESWSLSLTFEIMGSMIYVVDDNGDFIVSDAGEYTVADNGDYVPTGQTINTYRSIII